MSSRQSPLYWSFPCGSLFLTRIRISVYFPLLFIVLCLQLEDLQLGLIFGTILFLVVLAHEFGHILAARTTGGMGNEILIWPLGGLAYVQPAGTLRSQLLTPAAGPLVNLAICGATLWPVLESPYAAEAFHPFKLPNVELGALMAHDVLVLTFCASWILLLINLIPVYPLDGGMIVLVNLQRRLDGELAADIYIRVGFFAAFAMLLVGLIASSIWLVTIGAMVLVLNMQESQQIRSAEGYDDSFMGYDFSQGYTSLERDVDTEQKPRRGLLKRWREERRAERLRKLRLKDDEVVEQLDALLEKVHTHGMDSLTDAERRKLKRASDRFREKEQ